MSLGILFPGQGSQSIGMLKDLKSSYSIVSEVFEEASDILSCDLWKITKNGPESKINDTEFTQPIIFCFPGTLSTIGGIALSTGHCVN